MSNIKKVQARNNLHRRVSEFLSEGNGVKNMISLLKDKFTAEGFEESAINEEFANLTLTVHYENKSILPSLQLKTRQTSKNSQNDYKESDSKDHTNSHWMESTSMSKDVCIGSNQALYQRPSQHKLC